ncbi:hypothetical protein J7643_05950 [bacterium]|nr:hypothetical protein [bacterium]
MQTKRPRGLGWNGAALLALALGLAGCQSTGALQATPAEAGVLSLTATMSQPIGGAPMISLALADLPAPLRDAKAVTLLAGGVETSGIRAASAMDFAFTGAFPATDANAKLRGVLAADGKTVRLAEIALIRP